MIVLLVARWRGVVCRNAETRHILDKSRAGVAGAFDSCYHPPNNSLHERSIHSGALRPKVAIQQQFPCSYAFTVYLNLAIGLSPLL